MINSYFFIEKVFKVERDPIMSAKKKYGSGSKLKSKTLESSDNPEEQDNLAIPTKGNLIYNDNYMDV